MIFHRTKDVEMIRSIATHPKIWPTLGDDLLSDPAEWKPLMHDGIWYVLAEEDCQTRGLFVFFPENSVCWQVHICMRPEAWGSAARALREVFEWLWKQTTCQRITGSVPVWNAPAIACALKAGMQPFGGSQVLTAASPAAGSVLRFKSNASAWYLVGKV